MTALKKLLFSERGMQLVNGIFFLSALIPNRGVILAAYLLWTIYLLFCIRRTDSRVMKLVYTALLLFASAGAIINLCSYLLAS